MDSGLTCLERKVQAGGLPRGNELKVLRTMEVGSASVLELEKWI